MTVKLSVQIDLKHEFYDVTFRWFQFLILHQMQKFHKFLNILLQHPDYLSMKN